MKLFYLLAPLFLMTTLYGTSPNPECNFTPTFYGTLLEFATVNNAPGQVTIQPCLYSGKIYGLYDDDWKVIHENVTTLNPQVFAYVGITKHFQVVLFMESETIWYKGHSATGFSDLSFALGWQFLWDKKNTPIPNLRFDAITTFPTGKYDRLGTEFNGFNATGFGSYAASFVLVLNKTFYWNPCHPFNINLSLLGSPVWKTNLHGVNVYGGAPDTDGVIHPGPRALFIFSFELYLKSSLNFTLDLEYLHTFPNSFHGFPGSYPGGIPAPIFTSSSDLFTIAPSLEFRIAPAMALYIGGFFTAIGRNNIAAAEGVVSLIASF